MFHNTVFIFFLALLFFVFVINPVFYLENGIDVLKQTKKYKPILEKIINNKDLKNSKFFCFEKYSYLAPGLIPYLEKNKIYLYDINGYKRGSFDSYIKTYFKKEQTNKIDSFVNNLKKDDRNYLFVNNLSNTDIPTIIILEGKQYKVTLKLVDKIEECIFAIYKIETQKID